MVIRNGSKILESPHLNREGVHAGLEYFIPNVILFLAPIDILNRQSNSIQTKRNRQHTDEPRS
jgi:hypothetical protein